MSKDYFQSTTRDMKAFLLTHGYSGEGEAEFDRIIGEVRRDFPDLLSRPQED